MMKKPSALKIQHCDQGDYVGEQKNLKEEAAIAISMSVVFVLEPAFLLRAIRNDSELASLVI